MDFQLLSTRVTLGRRESVIDSPYSIAVRCANEILNSTQQNINLLLSGGVDSEAMALAFLATGNIRRIKVCIMALEKSLNLHDIKHAIKFCQSHGLDYQIYELNLDEFFTQYWARFQRNVGSFGMLSFTSQAWLIEKIGGYCVRAGDPPGLSFTNAGYTIPSPTLDDLRTTRELSIDVAVDTEDSFFQRFMKMKKIEGVSQFFSFSDDLILSFIDLPIFQNAKFYLEKWLAEGAFKPFKYKNLIEINEINYSYYQFKVEMYKQGGFDVRAKENKFTGFEKIPTIDKLYLKWLEMTNF